jgi:hypothetical protein
MPKQFYWEDVDVGTEMPTVSKVGTSRMLVQFAGGGGDFNPLHYEDDFAKGQGVGNPIIHGQLKRAWLSHLAMDFAGPQGMVKKLTCQFRGMDWPRKMKTMTEPFDGDTWLVKGNVAKKYTEGDEHLVDCEIWVENAKGEKTTPGTATVALPTKG